jgi:DNA-binding NtrC family response regulator
MGNAIATELTIPALVGPRLIAMPMRPPLPGSLRPRPLHERQAPVHELGGLAAVSRSMADVMAAGRRLARTSVTITIAGETGTGKDVFAHALHAESPRSAEPFVVFDCSAVAPTLIESELFGHERGAFTGAVNKHPGAFERAFGGTLFLDEIGELPLDLQPKLLRALENRSIKRVGGTTEIATDVRVIAATNRDLAAEVAAKQFRQDLYFRLAAAVLSLPPLRARLDDLPLLVQRLLESLGHGDVKVSSATLGVLRAHSWPGNVRELKNALARALAFADEGTIEPGHVQLVEPPAARDSLARLPLGGQRLETIEQQAIVQTLLQTGGNKARAADLLGIAVSTLYEKLKKYGI